jgi:hypothetical protein
VLTSLGLSEGKELTLNSLVPCAAALNGIGLTATIGFLACLGIDAPDYYYMKRMFSLLYCTMWSYIARNESGSPL